MLLPAMKAIHGYKVIFMAFCFYWFGLILLINNFTHFYDNQVKILLNQNSRYDVTPTKSIEAIDIENKASAKKHNANNLAVYNQNMKTLKSVEESYNIKYYLVAVAFIRIDYSNFNESKEMENALNQWVRHIRFAGVEHIYLYHSYFNMTLGHDILFSLKESCSNNSGRRSFEYVTYHDWGGLITLSSSAHELQQAAYNHALSHYGNQTKWMMASTTDEYPLSVHNRHAGFLARFLVKYSRLSPMVAEYSLQNFIFSTEQEEERNAQHNNSYVIQRYVYRKPNIVNGLDTPVFKPKCVITCGLHHNRLNATCGHTQNVNPGQVRINRYSQTLTRIVSQTAAVKNENKLIFDLSAIGIVKTLRENYQSLC